MQQQRDSKDMLKKDALDCPLRKRDCPIGGIKGKKDGNRFWAGMALFL
jgi:hypothetical protein